MSDQKLITDNQIQTPSLPLHLHDLVHQEGDYGAEILSIVEHYTKRCCRDYYSLTDSDQQDIAQEASIKLLINYENLQYTISKRWIYVMIKNLCLDVLRKQRSKNQLISPDEDPDTDNYAPLELDAFEPSDHFDNYECLDNVFAYIKSQPTGHEDFSIYSHYAYGLSREDIAYITGRTVSAVTKRLSVLRMRLKKLRSEIC